jgi:hypothetical protein
MSNAPQEPRIEMKRLPYRAQTQTGDVFDIEFPLHADTRDAVRVGQLVSGILQAVDRDFTVAGEMSNGDVLQALSMACAIRAKMIHARKSVTQNLATDLLATALGAEANASRQSPAAGHS